jgi:alpha-mannosidase
VTDISQAREIPSQIIALDGQKYLRIWAENVPSLGYKAYEIVSGAPTITGGGPSAAGTTLENAFVRLDLAPNGAIASLVDKTRAGREFVRTIDGRRMNDLGLGSGTVVIENSGPVSASLRVAVSASPNRTTTVTIYRDSPRIDVSNEITQNFGGLETWSFGINLDNPDVWHEEIGAVIRARLAEQGGHYASKAARYDWLSLNHFVDVSSGGMGMALSSPDLSFFRLGRSEPKAFDVQTPKISILAGGQVDGASLGIPNQGGDSHFLQRFALQTHGTFDSASAMRFALEHQNPFVTGEVTDGSAYPETS